VHKKRLAEGNPNPNRHSWHLPRSSVPISQNLRKALAVEYRCLSEYTPDTNQVGGCLLAVLFATCRYTAVNQRVAVNRAAAGCSRIVRCSIENTLEDFSSDNEVGPWI
jgi:hypothetical protein